MPRAEEIPPEVYQDFTNALARLIRTGNGPGERTLEALLIFRHREACHKVLRAAFEVQPQQRWIELAVKNLNLDATEREAWIRIVEVARDGSVAAAYLDFANRNEWPLTAEQTARLHKVQQGFLERVFSGLKSIFGK